METTTGDANINLYQKFKTLDVRYIVLAILVIYLILGFTVLGFNRTPTQAIITCLCTMIFEVVLCYIFKKKLIFPLSALITSCSLSLLLNYSHNYWILLAPVFFSIGSKYFFTLDGKHVFNPAQIAVTLSLLITSGLITAAPAYQWNGIESMGAFIAMLGIFFLLPRINRHWLVISFLITFTIQTFLRAQIMKHHLPFETLFLGTLTSPPFFLFTFFMITDPATSPKSKKAQIWIGIAIATIDLLFHLRQSYFTFFFAGATVQGSRLVLGHATRMFKSKTFFAYIRERMFFSGHYKRVIILLCMAFLGREVYGRFILQKTKLENLNFSFQKIEATDSGINPIIGETLTRVDPRIQHLAKWLLSVGDAVSVGDYDQDGLQDLFFTFPLKKDGHRCSLYKNLGNFKFQKIELPIIKETTEIERYGLGSNGLFADYDNDGDLDLLITFSFGKPIFLQNQMSQTGSAKFKNITKEIGLSEYTNSLTANYFDFNNDGRLDIFMGNVWPKYLRDYPEDKPEFLNLFKLPEAEYKDDERMYNFMHASWHMANNGGVNELYIQDENGKFIKQDSKKLGLLATRWTLAIGTSDFNRDGFTDIYVANDFGADDLYYNVEGKRFKNIKGRMFGDIGKDTYKGMNATVADFDNNGWTDVYISNVHHEYQAEGSLLWMFFKSDKKFKPEIKEMATKTGALNENRFGWGATAADFNNDGYTDMAQANGMVDDLIDKKWEECPDYWYVNEKIARSAPSYHRYTNKWGDIRGFCIYGKERNRLYLNTGKNKGESYANMFVDVAPNIGMTQKTNSRGMAAADLDNDGVMDLIVTHQFRPPTIYRNKLKVKKSWVGFSLLADGKTCNLSGVGSRVTLKYNKKTQMREKVIANGFSAQADNRLHFGLGNYQGEIVVEVDWCLRSKQTYKISNLNKYQVLKMEAQ
jgi:hypothetical protein